MIGIGYPPLYRLTLDPAGATVFGGLAPAGLVTAFGATSFAVTISSLTGVSGTTARLQTRARGSAAAWTTRASGASPAPNDVLTATGLTTATNYEWRLVETTALGEVADGTHGVVTPASAIWLTLLATVETVLVGLGVSVYKGETFPPNPQAAAAILRQRAEVERAAGNGCVELEYPVEVELQLIETSDTGELRTEDVATYHDTIRRAFDKRGAETYPSIPGLSAVATTVRSKTDARVGEDGFSYVTRAVLEVRFSIVEAR